MQNIKRNKGQKVVDELTILVNNSLENIISLQSREISVWYLPKGNKNTVGYYLFDIFLYNDTDKIKYSNAVKEIHDFYNFISSRKSLQVSYGLQNNINIDFEYGIGLGFELTRFGIVDLSVQTGFKSLVKIGDELKLEPLVNHVTISDINWCIRTEFTAVDLETIGRHTHHIKLTNTILFKDQFDTEPYRDSNTLYTCISYLVDENEIKHRNSEMMPDIVGIGDDAPSDSIETHSIVFDKASNAAVAGFILVLILLTLFKVKSALTKRQLRAEDHSDGIETGDRTLRYSVDEPYNRSKLTDNTTVVEDGKRFAENNVKDCLNNERIDEHDHRRTGREVDDCTTEENTIANDDKQAKTITFK